MSQAPEPLPEKCFAFSTLPPGSAFGYAAAEVSPGTP